MSFRGRSQRGPDREAVFFREAEWRSSCLTAIWRDFSGPQVPICGWLISIAAEITGSVRATLQQAIGILLSQLPNDVFDNLILPLADAGVAERWFAANCLTAALDIVDDGILLGRIKKASELVYGSAAASVAALLIGGIFSQTRPSEAAECLIYLVEHREAVDAALGIGVEGVIREAHANATSAQAILDKLANWPRWEGLEISLVHDVLFDQLHDIDMPALSNKSEIMPYLIRKSEREKKIAKVKLGFVDTAEIIAIISAATLNSEIDEEKSKTSTPQSVQSWKSIAELTAVDNRVATSAAVLLLRLLRFAPSRVTAWAVLRGILVWSNQEKAKGAVEIVRALFLHASERERERLSEHLMLWGRDSRIRRTIEAHMKAAPPA